MVSLNYPIFEWFDPIVSLSPKTVLLFQKDGFGMNEFVLFGEVNFFFNTTVQKGVYQFVEFLFYLINFLLNILGVIPAFKTYVDDFKNVLQDIRSR